ncbi:hypothetical protein ACUOFU_16770 [Microbacterium arabinogalactanolyticum]|uniref:hypothetical protein n=1 Tax=Microbacterium arabinogalactanolyticum TaxID=69365 RepID=UPI004044EFF0
METNWVAILVGLLGAGGVGAAVREIVGVVTLARKGVSGREDKRKTDIVAQRDHAIAMQAEAEAAERAADDRADLEAEERRHWQEVAARMRRIIIESGGDPGPWPTFTSTPKES